MAIRATDQADPWREPDPALALALQQIRFYAVHRDRSRKSYAAAETIILLTTAATTLAAALQASPWLTASLAAVALVIAGFKRIFNWHDSWLAYGAAWASMHVALNEYRLACLDGPDPAARQKLIEKVNAVVIDETTAWAARRRAMAEREQAQR